MKEQTDFRKKEADQSILGEGDNSRTSIDIGPPAYHQSQKIEIPNLDPGAPFNPAPYDGESNPYYLKQPTSQA